MGRTPTIRTDYRKDAITVYRMIGALQKDTLSDPNWVSDLMGHLEAARKLMMDHTLSRAIAAGAHTPLPQPRKRAAK